MSRKRSRRQSPNRRAAATVELAICLPVLMAIILGSIEAANAIYPQQSATVAAYEVIQAVTKPGGIQADGIARGNQFLTDRAIAGGTITITPTIDGSTASGTVVTVAVQIPVNQNAYAFSWFFTGRAMRAQVVMPKL